MIVTIFLYVIGGIIGFVGDMLPVKTIWPSELTDGITYLGTQLSRLNIIFPVFELSQLLLFAINFFIIYFGVVIFLMIVNFFRGSGKIEI